MISRIILITALVGLATTAFGPVFAQPGTGWPDAFLLAIVIPCGVAALWAMLLTGLPGRHDLPLTAAGVLGVLAAVASTTKPGAAVLSGPHRLLTGALPTDPTGPELATVAALCGYAVLVSGYLIVRGRSALLPLVPPLVCLVLGVGLAASVGGPPGWSPPAFVLLAALQVLVAHWRDGSSVRSLTGGLLAVALVVLATIVFSPFAPRIGARTPADLRALLNAPVQPRQHVNPLAQYLAFRDGPLPMEITGTANTPFDRLRMVTLTEFDGTAWTVRADYRRAGTQLPPAPEATRRTLVEADLALRFPDSLGWLPTPGRATTVSVAGLGVDATTGDIVIPAGTSTPTTYHVAGQQPDINKDELAGDEPAPTSAPLAVQLPQNISLFAQTAIAGQPDPWGRFSALYQAFQDPAYHVDMSKLATGGNGLYQISALLHDHKGTSEQYASAFALLSRHLGWDARVVLGFQPHWDGTRFTARGEDIAAWVEVRFTHLGWVPVDPTPQRTTEGQTQPQQNDDPVRTAVDAQQTPLPPPESPNDPPSPDIPATTAHDDGPALDPLLLAALGAVLLLVLAAPVAKAIRRWRRRHAHSIRDQAAGAWREAVDSLRECRIPVPRNATTGQIVEVAAHVAGDHVRELATLVDYAVYGPSDLTPAQLRLAWQASARVRQVARQQHNPLARLGLAIDPRQLRWIR